MPQERKLNYCFKNLKSLVSVGEFARHFHCVYNKCLTYKLDHHFKSIYLSLQNHKIQET